MFGFSIVATWNTVTAIKKGEIASTIAASIMSGNGRLGGIIIKKRTFLKIAFYLTNLRGKLIKIFN